MSDRIEPSRRPVGRPGADQDVRGAILAATLRQLKQTGSPDRVTVAAVVAEAGCTAPSLYHYWPTRDLLLHEASARGWSQFRASQNVTVAVVDRLEPLARIRLRGKAYLDFALAEPALFRVLFLHPQANGSAVPRGERPADMGDALHELITDVTSAMATGQLRPGDPIATGLALWAAVHGVAALWAMTPTLATDLAHAVSDLAQDAILAGLSDQTRE